MNILFLLLVLALVMTMADVNPDNGAGKPDGDSGSIASLDEAMTDEKPEGEADPARSDTTKPDGEGGDKAPLILNKFKTQEDLATAYQELERKLTEVTTKPPAAKEPEVKEEWVELSDEQLTALQETDPEAHKWYLAEKASRELEAKIDAKLDPLKNQLKPLDDLQKEAAAEKFFAQEDSIESQSKKMFGDEFEKLDKQRQDVKFLNELVKTVPKPLMDAIFQHNSEGSPQYARQLLLGQIQIYNMRMNAQKRSMSVSPDVGTSGSRKPSDTAASLDEAGELAAQELGIK